MSLANTLLNGGMVGSISVDASKYSHSTGASRIAMESVAELHDIFMESFYNPEQAELAAATEGVALEGSQYEAVAEAAVSNAFAKIKEFVKKLWEKVKAFFHNVKRYMDAIFMSGADFVKKYAQDIRNVGPLKDFEFKMFKYDDTKIDSTGSIPEAEEMMNTLIGDAEGGIKNLIDAADLEEKDAAKANAEIADTMEEIRKNLDSDNVRKTVVKEMSGGKCTDPDNFDEYLFGIFRNGATDTEDKAEIEIKSIAPYADILKETGKLAANLDKGAKRVDAGYAKAIKMIDSAENKLARKSTKVSGNLAEVLRMYSSALSIEQNYANKLLNAWKTVVKERDTAYKAVIMAAFAHAKKQKKAAK